MEGSILAPLKGSTLDRRSRSRSGISNLLLVWCGCNWMKYLFVMNTLCVITVRNLQKLARLLVLVLLA